MLNNDHYFWPLVPSLLAPRYRLKFNLEYFTLIDKEYFRYYHPQPTPFAVAAVVDVDAAKWRAQNSSSFPLTLLNSSS